MRKAHRHQRLPLQQRGETRVLKTGENGVELALELPSRVGGPRGGHEVQQRDGRGARPRNSRRPRGPCEQEKTPETCVADKSDVQYRRGQYQEICFHLSAHKTIDTRPHFGPRDTVRPQHRAVRLCRKCSMSSSGFRDTGKVSKSSWQATDTLIQQSTAEPLKQHHPASCAPVSSPRCFAACMARSDGFFHATHQEKLSRELPAQRSPLETPSTGQPGPRWLLVGQEKKKEHIKTQAPAE